jgi:hypothetical protein
MKNFKMASLLQSFERGDTLRLVMYDGSNYVVNNANYKKKDFLVMLGRVESFIVSYYND